jgi:hypothetical protein
MDTITRVACCLTIRDCYPYLLKIFNNLDLLSKKFKLFTVIFIYDNCTDNSEKLLQEYKRRSKFYVFVIHNIGNNSDYRTVRIANSRNKYLYVVYNIIKDIDFHIVIDADNVNTSRWNIELINHYIHHDTWDAISFNRSNGYYDIYALLYGNVKHNCWGYKKHSHYIIACMRNDIENRLQNTEKHSLLKCLSAFNGLSIYRTKKFKNCFYDGLYKNIKSFITDQEREETVKVLQKLMSIPIEIDEDCIENCEHVFYHLSAIQKNNARIRISKHNYI